MLSWGGVDGFHVRAHEVLLGVLVIVVFMLLVAYMVLGGFKPVTNIILLFVVFFIGGLSVYTYYDRKNKTG